MTNPDISSPIRSIDFDLPLVRTAPTRRGEKRNTIRAGLRLYIDCETGLFRSAISKNTDLLISQDYEVGSLLGVPMGDRGIGEEYLFEYVEHVAALRPQRLLEIASGIGQAAIELSLRGIAVVGIDPNLKPPTNPETNKLLTLVNGFFPQHVPRDLPKFDLVCSHAFLEHADDPVSMLRVMSEWCNPDGFVLAAVPDCSDSIEQGDCSMLLHEHRSYFTPLSLFHSAFLAGLTSINISKSKFGGVLYLVAKASGENIVGDVTLTDYQWPESSTNDWNWERQILRFALNRNKVVKKIESFDRGGGLRLIYVPHRIINFIDGILESIPVDDADCFQDTLVEGFRHRVRSLDRISDRPDMVLLASHSFEIRLRESIQNRWDGVPIVTLRELLSQ